MSLRSLVTSINSDATANAVVEKIENSFYTYPGGEQGYLTSWFDQDVRTRLFDGSVITGRNVVLSPRARLLKSALQRRHVSSGCVRFPPIRAYHITSSRQIAALIAKSGFRSGGGNYGDGAYFFGSSQAAEKYEAPLVGEALPIILEVVIYSRVTTAAFPTGGDQLTFFFKPKDIYLVKNPLVIFPTAAFHRGEKFKNVGVDL